MREKALRLLMSIPFLMGSLAAYPQQNFPENLNASAEYWAQVVNFTHKHESDLLRQSWETFGVDTLRSTDFDNLLTAYNVTDFLIGQLDKKSRQFLFKQAHLGIYLSGMNPVAHGLNDRAGIWMLSFPDARRYGLRVDASVDERLDFIKSTQAARAYLEDLKKIRGTQAELAFIVGSAAIEEQKPGSLQRMEGTLSAIKQTYKSVPKNFRIEPKNELTAYSFEGRVRTDLLKKELKLSNEEFRAANPTLIGSTIPAGIAVKLSRAEIPVNLVDMSATYERRLSRRRDSLMNRIKNNIPSPETHKVVTYRVKSGDVLGRIAQHYGVSVSKLKKWNDLRSDRIDINQKLTIYLKKGRKTPPTVIAKTKTKPEVKLTKEEKGEFTIYEVQPGDTLWAISKQFDGVKPEQIMAWNNIDEHLSVGQKLKIKTH